MTQSNKYKSHVNEKRSSNKKLKKSNKRKKINKIKRNSINNWRNSHYKAKKNHHKLVNPFVNNLNNHHQEFQVLSIQEKVHTLLKTTTPLITMSNTQLFRLNKVLRSQRL